MSLRRTVAAAALLASAAWAFAGPGDPLDPLRPALERQDQLVGRGQFDVLVSEARQKAREGTPEALYLLGRALGNTAVARRAEGRESEHQSLLAESQRCFEDARDSGLVPFAPAHLGLARCFRMRGDFAAAERSLREALRISPDFRAAFVDLAQVLAESGRAKDAEDLLRGSLAKRPDDPEVRTLLGMLKMSAHRPDDAESEFREALRLAPDSPILRKLLGGALLEQRKFADAAQHFDAYRRLEPKDEEVYRVLFVARMKTRDRAAAAKVLEDARRDVPGTPTAIWAAEVASEYAKDPAAFEEADEKSPQALSRKLESPDPAVVAGALRDMRGLEWQALPAAVYRLLAPTAANADVRRAAVALIGAQHDARTLTVLEILLFHPREQDPDAGVRREAAAAIAGLPTPAIVPILVRALDQSDPDVREAAVRGIAATTGKWFREKLETPTPADAWAAERRLYDAWWRSAGGSLVKRDACAALTKLFAPIQRGRRRLAEYALPAVEDADPRTWRAGYDLFRSLAAQDFGSATGEPDAAERSRIARACRDWFGAQGNQE